MVSLSINWITHKQDKELVFSNYHNTPSHPCDIVTEDDFSQPIYHPHINFFKATNSDSLFLLLVKMSDVLTSPSIFLVSVCLYPLLSDSMWYQNQWYLKAINLLAGFRRSNETTTMVPALSSKTDDTVTALSLLVLRMIPLRVSLASTLNRSISFSDCDSSNKHSNQS